MATEVAEAVAAMIVERQNARTSDYSRRVSALAEVRKTFKRRRAVGLKRRHAEKLARIQQERLV